MKEDVAKLRALAVVGLTFLVVGVFLVLFGMVYTTNTSVVVQVNCGFDCSRLVSGSVSSAYYLYPIWSPPTWKSASGLTSYCINSWYTPFPPTSCVPQPNSTSTNYILNAVGVIWVIGGVVFFQKDRGLETTRSAPPVEQII